MRPHYPAVRHRFDAILSRLFFGAGLRGPKSATEDAAVEPPACMRKSKDCYAIAPNTTLQGPPVRALAAAAPGHALLNREFVNPLRESARPSSRQMYQFSFFRMKTARTAARGACRRPARTARVPLERAVLSLMLRFSGRASKLSKPRQQTTWSIARASIRRPKRPSRVQHLSKKRTHATPNAQPPAPTSPHGDRANGRGDACERPSSRRHAKTRRTPRA